MTSQIQRIDTLCRIPTLVALLVVAVATAQVRADVVGIGDHIPAHEDSFGESISDLPQFGGDQDLNGDPLDVIIVGGTGQQIGGTASGQMTIDIPSETSPLISNRGIIGGTVQGLGLVRIVELNSQWSINQDLIIGEFGQGFLEIIGGGRLATSTAGVPAAGVADLIIGLQSTSQGFVTLDGFSSLMISTNAVIGGEGFGSVEVLNRARFESLTSAYIGGFENTLPGALNEGVGEGYVLVDGLGSRWNVGLQDPPGTTNNDMNLYVGQVGHGVLEIRNQGRTIVSNDTYIGVDEDASGEISVDGRNSLFSTGGDIFIGGEDATDIDATGIMRVSNRAVARSLSDTVVGPRGLLELSEGTYQSVAPANGTRGEITNFGVIRGSGRIESEIINNGDIRTAASIANLRERLWVTGPVLNNAGAIIESVGGEMEFESPVLNNGQIYAKNAIMRFRAGVTGVGEVVSDNSIFESPLLAPVSAANVVLANNRSQVLGSVTLDSMEIGVGKSEFSQLFVTGSADIDGNLDVTLSSGYTPEVGDSFEILRSGLLSGTFSTLTVNNVATPPLWNVAYVNNSVFLNYGLVAQPVFASDFNGDGAVDGADLVAWTSGFGTGSSKSQGDATGDGVVDGRDFLSWQRQYGSGATVTPATSAVPEPGAFALALAAFALPWRRRLR